MKHLLALSATFLILGAGCAMNQTTGTAPLNTLNGEHRTATTTANQDTSSNTTADAPSIKKGKILDLSGKGLTKIPSDVFSRTDLEELDLSMNKLTGAPQAEIRHLANLKILNLSGNALTGLPAELGQLRYLEVLDVSNNQLTGLPLELGNLTQLRILDLRGNTYSQQDLDQISAKLQNTDIRR